MVFTVPVLYNRNQGAETLELSFPLKSFRGNFSPMGLLVRVEGFEPPCLAAPEPKSGASTNFATPALGEPTRSQLVTDVAYQSRKRYARGKGAGLAGPCFWW